MFRAGDRTAREPRGQVDPAIRTEHRRIDPELRALRRVEAGQQHPPHIGVAVSLGVLQIQHVGGAGHDQAALPRHDPVGIREAVGEDRPFVHAAVAVGVFQHCDHALRRIFGARIAPILRHEEPALFIESQRARRGQYERFGGHEFDPHVVRRLKGMHRLVRCQLGAQRGGEEPSREGQASDRQSAEKNVVRGRRIHFYLRRLIAVGPAGALERRRGGTLRQWHRHQLLGEFQADFAELIARIGFANCCGARQARVS